MFYIPASRKGTIGAFTICEVSLKITPLEPTVILLLTNTFPETVNVFEIVVFPVIETVFGNTRVALVLLINPNDDILFADFDGVVGIIDYLLGIYS
jgi:hypothetical protein